MILIGAESTGKTTLAQELAEHYDEPWVPEFGREFTVEKYGRGDFEWRSDEFVTIAEEQQRQENEAASRARRVVFGDTNAFATAIWHERYMGFRHPEVERIAALDVVDLYFLCGTDVPFEEDEIRDGEAIRDWMDRVFEEEIVALRVPCIRLFGSPENRFFAAVENVDRLLGG